MFEGSGAVEVIKKDYSKKIKNYWGGEMVEKIDDITKYIPKKLFIQVMEDKVQFSVITLC